MKEKIAIHDTAFVTAGFRASNVALSKDNYAHLWPTHKTEEHMEEYTSEVSVFEPVAHCLRNRYFYETIKGLHAIGQIEVVLNFGSGFSMYPFLLDESLIHIEIDQDFIIQYKKDMIGHWQSCNYLPKRNIHFLSCDFNNGDQLQELFGQIKSILGDKPSFILLEGVLFFLGKSESISLFNFFARLQQKDDYLGSVSFRDSISKARVFRSLINFMEKKLEKNASFEYQTLEDSFYRDQSYYTLEAQQHTLKLARSYCPDITTQAGNVLNEHMYILKRNQFPYFHGY